jgi:hypothetical protein
MKLHAPNGPWLIAFTLLVVLVMGCDDRESERAAAGVKLQRDQPDASTATLLPEIRTRAEHAFNQSKAAGSRFQTRIGPQPWPGDLPKRWPRPTRAVVVAYSRSQNAERLLLVDLPGSPAREFAAYVEALLETGFEIDTTGGDGVHGSLRVVADGVDASLRFLAHARHTRLEILFRPKRDAERESPPLTVSAARQTTG